MSTTYYKLCILLHLLHLDISQTPWQSKDTHKAGDKVREVSMTLTLNNSMGPKNACISETQVNVQMLSDVKLKNDNFTIILF